MQKQSTHRLRKWKDNNASLVQRGSITFWFDEESIANWHSDERTGKRGRPLLYSDIAIEFALTLRAIFHLPLRATEGFVKSIIQLANLPLSCPDYTTFCKRKGDLEICLPKKPRQSCDEGLDIVVDSTGMKVYGEGEWKVRQHGYTKRRTWRKLHLAIDSETQGIEAAVLTTNDFKDSEVLPDLMEQIEGKVKQLSGDGGYDSHETYEYIASLGASPVIPPRKDAFIAQHGNCKAPPKPRDKVLRAIRKVGRKNWKKQSGYHKRSLAETAMFRFKILFGNTLSSREFDNQGIEALVKCKALNKITSLGMPDSYIFQSF